MPRGECWILIATLLAGMATRGGAGEAFVLPDDRLGVRTAPLLLLSRPDVRADLKLDPAQLAATDSAIHSIRTKAMRLRGLQGDAAIAGRRAIDEEQERWLEGRLTESQRSRLVQIDLQWEGPAALVSRPALSQSLGLDAGQRDALRRAFQESVRRRATGTWTLADERAFGRESLGRLTPPQRQQWLAILGRPFDPKIAAVEAGRRRGSSR